jgi:glutamyl-tRNA synthetase
MSVSGILFDMEKLKDIGKDVFAKIPAGEIAAFMEHWSAMYDHPAHEAMQVQTDISLAAALDIGRTSDKPRKDLAYAKQIWQHINYFYEGFYKITDPLPENVSEEDEKEIAAGYLETYSHTDDREAWFGKVRDLAEKLGYAVKPKDYKKEPDKYKGHVGDVSAVIRRALTGRLIAPDIYEIQQVLGETETKARIEKRVK